jgi:phage tail protein X
MSDLHEARDPEREPQIDTVGWLFATLAVAIIVAAVTVVYRANHTIAANAPVSQIVAR